jgi:hypothetical protein
MQIVVIGEVSAAAMKTVNSLKELQLFVSSSATMRMKLS